eukprot:6747634-Pyramimonas_sp.AAC.1
MIKLWRTTVHDIQKIGITDTLFVKPWITLSEAEALIPRIQAQITKYEDVAVKTRIKIWRAKMSAAMTGSATATDRRTLKNHMRPPRDEPITALALDLRPEENARASAVKCGDKKYAVISEDVLHELRKVWQPIFDDAEDRDWH